MIFRRKKKGVCVPDVQVHLVFEDQYYFGTDGPPYPRKIRVGKVIKFMVEDARNGFVESLMVRERLFHETL